jgi:hypothetical protein
MVTIKSAYKLRTQKGQVLGSYHPKKQNSRWLPGGHIENVTKRLIFERNLRMGTINEHTNFELNRAKHSEVTA